MSICYRLWDFRGKIDRAILTEKMAKHGLRVIDIEPKEGCTPNGSTAIVGDIPDNQCLFVYFRSDGRVDGFCQYGSDPRRPELKPGVSLFDVLKRLPNSNQDILDALAEEFGEVISEHDERF